MTNFKRVVLIHFLGINSEISQMFVDLKQAAQSFAEKQCYNSVIIGLQRFISIRFRYHWFRYHWIWQLTGDRLPISAWCTSRPSNYLIRKFCISVPQGVINHKNDHLKNHSNIWINIKLLSSLSFHSLTWTSKLASWSWHPRRSRPPISIHTFSKKLGSLLARKLNSRSKKDGTQIKLI